MPGVELVDRWMDGTEEKVFLGESVLARIGEAGLGIHLEERVYWSHANRQRGYSTEGGFRCEPGERSSCALQ